jgi:transcriptional regulator with XRE-family HTH domain
MTGGAVKRIRTRLGLDPFVFATMLGVHVSSVYRWEQAENPRVDPLQRAILAGLSELKISPRPVQISARRSAMV